jgi:hypothetical protein
MSHSPDNLQRLHFTLHSTCIEDAIINAANSGRTPNLIPGGCAVGKRRIVQSARCTFVPANGSLNSTASQHAA